jgi:YHS domain-containing protein
MSRTAIGAVRRGVRRLDRMHGWQRADGALWVNVVGIADGSIGMDGKPSTADEVVGHMTAEYRAQTDAGGTESPELAEGVVIDPMCGMHVRLGLGAMTLEHDGRTMGFCASACRAAYAREHGLPVPA